MKASAKHVAAAERMRQLPQELTSYAGFAEALAALAAGKPASLDGVWGSGCALVAAGLIHGATGPLVVVCPTQREADELAADLELFTATRPVLYPAWESEPDDRLVHDETFGDRLRVLKGLLQESGIGSRGSGGGVQGSGFRVQRAEVGCLGRSAGKQLQIDNCKFAIVNLQFFWTKDREMRL
jgi:hypothetical protein